MLMNRNILIGMAINIVIFFTMLFYGMTDYIGAYKFIESIFGGGGGTYEYSLQNNLRIMIMVFSRNSATAALILASGPLLAFMGFVASSFNGYIVGAVIAYNAKVRGYTLLKILGFLVPHGIIELPTIFYVTGISFDTAILFILDREEFHRRIRDYFHIYVKRVIPLLSIAAFIEAFITPIIGSMV